MRKQIWFAIAVCVIAVLPGLAIGAVAVMIWKLMVVWQIGPEPDFYMMRSLFSFQAPSDIIKWLMYSAVPAWLHGAIAGYFALIVTAWAYQGRNIEMAAYTTGALYSGALLMLIIMSFSIVGAKFTYVEAALQLIGLWCGLVAALQTVPNASATTSAT